MRLATFPAMGTTVRVMAPEPRAYEAESATRALFAEWEGALSRFRPESELSRLNQRAGESTVVGALLFEVTAVALRAAAATDGLYDPTLQRHLVEIGYDRSFTEMSPKLASATYAPRPGGDWRRIQLEHERRMILLPRGSGLDFGGIAKGMAVDAAVDRLRALGIAPLCVNAGGDLAVWGLPPGEAQWPIAVPGVRDARIIPLRQGALATSGIARRRWRQGAERRHHLLDPRTGAPAVSGLWSATVVADRCQQAEVAAKVAFLLGPQAGTVFLRSHRLDGLLALEAGDWRPVGAWSAEEWEQTYE
jgi:FAD:protein FMN transferase